MKKILFYTRPIAPPWDEASKNLAYDIATNMTQKKFRISLLTSKKAPLSKDFIVKHPWIKLESIYNSPKVNLNLLEKTRLLKRLLKLKLDADIIHFLFTPRNLTSMIIRWRLKFSRIKSVQTVATLSKENLQNPKKLKKILFADAVVVQSKNTFNKLSKIISEKTELIYPGINLKKYQPASKDSAILKKLGIKKGDFVVLYTGEYTRLKAIDDIIKAFEILRDKPSAIKGLKLILACRIKSQKDKNKKQEIIKLIDKNFLQKNIVFLDTFAEMEKLYNLSDINIFPAREMAGKFDLPLTLIESMACGKPIIVSKLKNLKELVGNNDRGLLCEKKNPKDLANKIYLLKSDKKMYNQMAKRALTFIKNNFDIKQKVKEYNQVYKNLIK